METQVLVVGAGPTGLTLACGLAAAGIDVRIVDAAAGPAGTSRALALQPRGVEVLHRLAALGGAVEWGRTVTGLSGDADGVTVGFDAAPAMRAQWAIGADGAHSAVRKSAGIDFVGAPLVEGFLLADVHAQLDRPRNATAVWLRGTGMLAAFPLPGDDLWRLMAPAPPDGAADVVAYLAARLAAEAGGTVHAAEWTSTFRIQRRLASAYRRGRVLLAGDAAHIHSPFGGQGMNTGLGDAENLAFKLALVISGRADAGLLDTYAAERRPIAKEVVASTSSVTVGALGGRRALRLVRDLAVPLLNQGWLQRLIIGKASGLQVSYRRGPFGARCWPPGGLHVGDRVPNWPGVDTDGTSIRLHDALGPAWALLGRESLADIARGRLGDVVGVRGDGQALLVRPDGHLAWRGTDPRALHARLDELVGPRTRVLTR